MIIHIIGSSGSGKTTLGKLIKENLSNVTVIDTDDVDDKNTLSLLSNPEFVKLYKEGNNKEDKLREKLNLAERNEIIDCAKTEGKHLIFVGMSFFGKADPHFIMDKGFCIKVEINDLYRRSYLRELESIHDGYNELKKIIKDESDPSLISLKSLHMYKIRRPFIMPYDMFKENELKRYKSYVEKGYTVLPPNDIYEEIKKLLTETPAIITDKVKEKRKKNKPKKQKK